MYYISTLFFFLTIKCHSERRNNNDDFIFVKNSFSRIWFHKLRVARFDFTAESFCLTLHDNEIFTINGEHRVARYCFYDLQKDKIFYYVTDYKTRGKNISLEYMIALFLDLFLVYFLSIILMFVHVIFYDCLLLQL